MAKMISKSLIFETNGSGYSLQPCNALQHYTTRTLLHFLWPHIRSSKRHKEFRSFLWIQPRLTRWVPPITGSLKLNTDGCWYSGERPAGFGGLFRDDHSKWCLGYYGKLSCTSSLEAELWGIYKGLAIILEKGMAYVKIESDALVTVDLINKGPNENHPLSAIIHDAKTILAGTNSSLIHVSRSANECADHLARIGAEKNEDLLVLANCPPSLREYLIRDGLNLRQTLD